jgi:glutamate formiminotransferase
MFVGSAVASRFGSYWLTVPIIECIPNFSEGRNPAVIAQICEAIRRANPRALSILDVHSDPDHHRSVVTFAGEPAAVEAGAFAAIQTAARLIDMEAHSGVHPRIGAADVVPFVPIQGASMADCVALAKRLGERVGRELTIPVYLYKEAATRPDRYELPDIRRGGYETLRTVIESDPDRSPDYGPARLGKAGAVAIGARPALIAYNVYLNTAEVKIAKAIARAIRFSSGGLRYVQAAGFLVGGRAQVSMNLLDYTRTPLHRVQALIQSEAQRYGVQIASSELIGLIPEAALIDTARWYLQLEHLTTSQVLESRLMAAGVNPFGSGNVNPPTRHDQDEP